MAAKDSEKGEGPPGRSRPPAGGHYAPRDSARIPALAPELLDQPLDYLAADHDRQRKAAELLTRLAEGSSTIDSARRLLAFLRRDFAAHIADEERDLFPLLRRRSRPGDNVADLIDVLREEHEEDEKLGLLVTAAIEAFIESGRLADADRNAIAAFADHVREHISLENGVLLPVARQRLDTDDLQALSAAMRRRRAGDRH